MRTELYILLIFILLTSCHFETKSPNQMINEIRRDFAKDAEIRNAKILAWERFIDSLYKIGNTDKYLSIQAIDKVINKDTSLDSHQKAELHFIKGDIYYNLDSFQKAIDEYSNYSFGGPKMLAARAGAYIKQKQYDKAFVDLNNAAYINYDYDWNKGNYYEIIGKKDSAIAIYTRLFLKDTVIYKQCKDRIDELTKVKAKMLTELIYRDRKRQIILLNGIK